jgi:predicted  nucleic acid-binding Zn-ribbon protein
MPNENLNGENSNSEGSSGTNPNAGGEGQNQSTTENKRSVSYETYLKTLDEAKSAKSRLKALEEERNKIAEEKLKAEGDWKGLLDLRESRIKELEGESNQLKEKYSGLNERVTSSQKLSKVLSKIGGDLDPKYYGLIDISEVKINPETGEIDDMSATKVAENYRTEYAETIRKKFNPNSMGENKPGGDNGQSDFINFDKWAKLPYNEQKKWKISQVKS